MNEKSSIFEQVSDGFLIKSDCFDPFLSCFCGQAFRWKTENQTLCGVIKDKVVRISEIEKSVYKVKSSKEFFFSEIVPYFDLNRNYAQILNGFYDEYLKKAVKELWGIRILKQDSFEAIISFIISQNNNIPRISGIIEKLCKNFGEHIEGDFYTFPTVETLAGLNENDLAVIKSGFRAKYIVDAARKISSGEINLDLISKMTLDEAMLELQKIKGIGPKVSSCALLYGFSFLNAFPVDVWVKRIMSEIYPEGLPSCTNGVRGIAQQYLFEYYRKHFN